MKNRYKIFSAILCSALLLTGCGTSSSVDAALAIYVTGPYIKEETVNDYVGSLVKQFPGYEKDEILVTANSAGDPDADPMSYLAASTAMVGALAAREIDILICDYTIVKRNNGDGDSYYVLSDLFTDEEINSFAFPVLELPILDDDYNETGAYYPPCGIDVSAHPVLGGLYPGGKMVVVIPINTTNLDSAREVLLHIAQGK